MNFLRSVNGGGYVGASDEILFWEAARYYSLFPVVTGRRLGHLGPLLFLVVRSRAWSEHGRTSVREVLTQL